MRYVKGLTRRICVALAERGKAEWMRHLSSGNPRAGVAMGTKEFPLELASFSSSRDMGEQCLSILTFLRWVGTPRRWTVYSDGSHSTEEKKVLESLGGFVEVAAWDTNLAKVSEPCVRSYAEHPVQHAMGKRLCAYSSHVLTMPVLFLDSDVFFYAKARELLRAALGESGHWFLPDVFWGHLDTRYMAENPERMYQLNGGFFLLQPSFDWSPVARALKSFSPDFQYFSDQTSYHVGLLGQGAKPLDPRFFVMDVSDQFVYASRRDPLEMAARHYTGPIRFKVWQYGWRWHFGGLTAAGSER